jgi:putative membrane protein
MLMCAIIIASFLVDGIQVNSLLAAIAAAGALGVLNAVFRPILFILTLPINLLTLGLFTFAINAFMLQIASNIIPGFWVADFSSALVGSLLISLTSWFLNTFINGQGKIVAINRQRGRQNPWE